MTILVGFDLETTGLSDDDRITEISLVVYRDQARVGEFTRRVNPQREVSAKAQAITGYTWASLKDEPTWDKIGQQVNAILKAADVIVTHNGKDFDMPMLGREQARIGLTLPNKRLVDTIEARWATWNGKLPSLRELAWSLGYHYDELRAHSASYDAELCLQCYLRGVEYGFFAA